MSHSLQKFVKTVQALAEPCKSHKKANSRLRAIKTACEFILDFNSVAERVRIAMAKRDMTITSAAAEMGVDSVSLGRICRGSFPENSKYEKLIVWLTIQEEKVD